MNAIEREILEIKGTASSIILELFGWELAETSAKKTLSVIRKFIRWKDKLAPGNKYQVQDDINEIIIKGDGTRTTKRMVMLSEDDLQDPDEVLFKMGLNPLNWELIDIKMRRRHWGTVIKNADSEAELHTQHSFAVEAKTKPKQSLVTVDYIEKIISNFSPPEMVIYRNRDRKTGKLLVMNIVDFHLGDRGRHKTIEDAKSLYRHTVTNALQQLHDCNIQPERIIFTVGNDFFHYDTKNHTTSNGTQMTETEGLETMFEAGIGLLEWAVENLRALAPVDIVLVPGNHDEIISYYTSWVLKGIYRGCDDVTFDTRKVKRKYIRWGDWGLGFGHADKEGKRILFLMQQEFADWSDTIYREFHKAHLHSESVEEVPGVKHRRLPTIVPKESWEDDMGYDSSREHLTFVYHQSGIRQIFSTPAPRD